MDVPDETLGALLDRWALPIGRLVLALGEIEHVTLDFLRTFDLPRGSAPTTTPLRQRLSKMRSIIARRSDIATAAPRLGALLDRIEELIEKRNIVAHNPVVFGVYTSPDTDELHLVDELVDQREAGTGLRFEALSELARDAHSIAMAFAEAYWTLPARIRSP